jgi:hypothetical protein
MQKSVQEGRRQVTEKIKNEQRTEGKEKEGRKVKNKTEAFGLKFRNTEFQFGTTIS